MEKVRAFLARKNITFSAKRYFIDAMSAMAQGLFCTLLVGTILDTIGKQFGIGFLTDTFLPIKQGDVTFYYTIGGFCSLLVVFRHFMRLGGDRGYRPPMVEGK